MEFFRKTIQIFMNILDLFKSLGNIFPTSKDNQVVYSVGPNNFMELLKQFDEPVKQKTEEDIVRDYQIKETMALLEIDMLKMEPTSYYRGLLKWKDNEGNIFFDWALCATRPEVIYCSYGKN